MRKIKDVLELPIRLGYINWEKLEKKIFSGLEYLNKFKHEERKKIEDAIIFYSKVNNIKYPYKIFEVRFKDGELYCSGFMRGNYLSNSEDIVWIKESYVRF